MLLASSRLKLASEIQEIYVIIIALGQNAFTCGCIFENTDRWRLACFYISRMLVCGAICGYSQHILII